MDKRIRWITTTAVFVALLIAVQAATAPAGQFVTGSLVNLILILSVMTCGLGSGLTVACLSPVFARLFGIGMPFWTIVLCIMAGNMVLVILWYSLARAKIVNSYVSRVVALVAAAVCKFLVLYFGVVKIALPLLNPPAKQAAAISAVFSYPQLVTALIGGALAFAALPLIERALKRKQ